MRLNCLTVILSIDECIQSVKKRNRKEEGGGGGREGRDEEEGWDNSSSRDRMGER